MSLHRFFLEHQVLAQESEASFPLRLSADDAKHARVLRLGVGEHIAVIDAASDYFECEIISFSDDVPLVRIASRQDISEQAPQLLLLQGIAKGDKMDTVVRGAVEVGVCGIIPLMCERSIVKLDQKKADTKQSRWQSITKSAAMQAGRLYVPEVMQPMVPQQAADVLHEATAVLVFWEEAPISATIRQALSSALASISCLPIDARVAVVVGPEGGLTQEEVDTFLTCNQRAHAVSLGPSILRTETAGIVAPALVMYELRRTMVTA